MKLTDYLLVLLSTFILGVNYVAVKIGVSEFPPIFMVALRFTIVASILMWFAKPPRHHFPAVLLFSFTMGTLHFGLIFIGFENVDASVVAIIFQLGVPMSVIFAWIFLGESFGWRRWVGIAIAFSGAALIAGAPQSNATLFYLAIVFVSVLAWSIASVQVKRLADYDAISLSAWMTLLAAPQLYLASFILESGQITALRQASISAWSGLGFTAIGASILGYGLWYHLIAKFSVGRILPFGFLAPLFGIASAVLFLGERLTLITIIGAALILSGVIFVQMRSLPKRHSSEPSDEKHDQPPIT
jgi:O-acetylserine/cysteine efflux transporter